VAVCNFRLDRDKVRDAAAAIADWLNVKFDNVRRALTRVINDLNAAESLLRIQRRAHLLHGGLIGQRSLQQFSRSAPHCLIESKTGPSAERVIDPGDSSPRVRDDHEMGGQACDEGEQVRIDRRGCSAVQRIGLRVAETRFLRHACFDECERSGSLVCELDSSFDHALRSKRVSSEGDNGSSSTTRGRRKADRGACEARSTAYRSLDLVAAPRASRD